MAFGELEQGAGIDAEMMRWHLHSGVGDAELGEQLAPAQVRQVDRGAVQPDEVEGDVADGALLLQ